ncbi:hypothetical protein BOX15_Mlig012512g1 [Macrostomum lignano]|uniref:Prefoldin subunit 5 n=1 Tax=Macrostomum lignano TaxID=282301 RepID=A0A267FR47_9PLAT|nr:hypothetical protein BOX15_Mlig012512g1 [Macrostomum lignano]
MAQSVPINQLSIPQLREVLEKIDEEMEFLTSSLQNLKTVQQKFMDSKEAVERLTPDRANSETLVPMTSTLYVLGRLCPPDKVTVDIGTGYYADMTPTQAADFFQRKAEFLAKEIEKVQPGLQEKYATKQVVTEVLQAKVKVAVSSQQASTAQAQAGGNQP